MNDDELSEGGHTGVYVNRIELEYPPLRRGTIVAALDGDALVDGRTVASTVQTHIGGDMTQANRRW